MIFTKRNVYIALAVCAFVGVFSPLDEGRVLLETQRTLQGEAGATPAPTPPPAAAFSCPPGMVETRVDWGAAHVESDVTPQTVTLSNGIKATLSYRATAPGYIHYFGFDETGAIKLTAGTEIDATDVIVPDGVNDPEYPAGYGTMVIEFEDEIAGLYISVSDVDSGKPTTDVVRIRMYNSAGGTTPITIAKTGSISVKDNFGYQGGRQVSAHNPGYEAALYAKASGGVKRIELDQSVFAFNERDIGKQMHRSIYPASDFAYCAEPDTDAPTPATGHPTMRPTMKPTHPPQSETLNPTLPPTLAPVPLPVVPAVPNTVATGVNGDPMIMGLGGQLFKFEGRSGAWYSAISTKSFQWNMKLQRFEGCPEHSDNFITGTGLTIFNSDKKHEIIVNVIGEHHTDVGCGKAGDKDYSCLGAGSLQMMIDGHKIVQSVDHHFEDGSGRVIAFNTIAKCSRRWFDFDVTPADEIKTSLTRGRRSLRNNGNGDGAISVLDGVKATMIDPEGCSKWIKDRKKHRDFFKQTGTWSTIIIKTNTVSFHIEYKQEQERCSAHSLDMWVSSVNPDVAKEQWEGVIGETKAPDHVPAFEHKPMERNNVLKFNEDEAYEVNSPFSTDCKGCTQP